MTELTLEAGQLQQDEFLLQINGKTLKPIKAPTQEVNIKDYIKTFVNLEALGITKFKVVHVQDRLLNIIPIDCHYLKG